MGVQGRMLLLASASVHGHALACAGVCLCSPVSACVLLFCVCLHLIVFACGLLAFASICLYFIVFASVCLHLIVFP